MENPSKSHKSYPSDVSEEEWSFVALDLTLIRLDSDQRDHDLRAVYGTSENAVRTQIWIAISVYVLVAIIKYQLTLEVSLHTPLQILSLTLFEKLQQVVAGTLLVGNDIVYNIVTQRADN